MGELLILLVIVICRLPIRYELELEKVHRNLELTFYCPSKQQKLDEIIASGEKSDHQL